MIIGSRLAALLDYNRAATEFTGDDVDRFTALVDLGRQWEWVRIDVPTIDSATVSIYVQFDAAVATVPVLLHYKLPADASTAAWATTAGTGGYSIVCPCLGGAQYIRLYTGANQTADRTFYVQGGRN